MGAISPSSLSRGIHSISIWGCFLRFLLHSINTQSWSSFSANICTKARRNSWNNYTTLTGNSKYYDHELHMCKYRRSPHCADLTYPWREVFAVREPSICFHSTMAIMNAKIFIYLIKEPIFMYPGGGHLHNEKILDDKKIVQLGLASFARWKYQLLLMGAGRWKFSLTKTLLLRGS